MNIPAPNSKSPPDGDALRVVLFGVPVAGKSSLLGALAQTAQTQEPLLHGRLTDLSHGLGELQRRLYEGDPQETLREIVPYPITLTPFPENRSALAPTEAVLVDSDGRVANDLLSRRTTLEPGSSEDSLASQIVQADALVLVIDASADTGQVEADFAEFARFLHLLEESRGRQSDVAGLPVFLVLTKCDLLAKPEDTPAAWIERIEEQKRQTGQRFKDFLAEDDELATFGSIDLNVWATAVKRPALVGCEARPRDPYGVAELFRECLAAARGFRARREHSQRRLRWTAAGAASMLLGMLALTGGLLATYPGVATTELEERVQNYRAAEGPSRSSWLREPLQERIGTLREFKQDPDFPNIPIALQQYVRERLEELEDYRSFKTALEQARSPATARTDNDLEEIEARLHGDLALPKKYEADWQETGVARRRQEMFDDLKAMRAAVAKTEEWFRDLKQRGDDLRLFSDRQSGEVAPVSWVDWHAEVKRLLLQAESPPFRRTDAIPGSHTINYAVVLACDRVAEARGEWERVRKGLERLGDITAALGLAGVLPGQSPLLRIPESGFTLEQSRSRWHELEKSYAGFREWTIPADLPDSVATELRRAADGSYRNLLRIGQEVVLRQLRAVASNGQETPQAWKEVGKWLANPDELRDWRELATFLARLREPKAEDPVKALATFLQQDTFKLEINRLSLHLPDDLRLRPVGKLTIFHGSGEKGRPVLSFHVEGEESRDVRRRITSFPFVPDEAAALVYRPGDALWATLEVKDAGDATWTLTWTRDHSGIYQFERLSRPPRLHRADEGPEKGKLLEERAWLTLTPATGIPRVPDLLPVVPLENRQP